MVTVFKTIISFILSFLSIFNLSGIFGSTDGNNSDVKNEQNILLDFAAISDIHMTDDYFHRIMLEGGLDDMEKMNQGMPHPKSNKDLFLISMYRDFLRSNPNISYNDFIDTYGDDLINKFNEMQRHGSWW